jgi:hypothetical protein
MYATHNGKVKHAELKNTLIILAEREVTLFYSPTQYHAFSQCQGIE